MRRHASTLSAVLLALCCFLSPLAAQPLRINELMADNDTTLADEWGEYDDWVELYNPAAEAVDAGGLYVADDEEESSLWQIPADRPEATTVPAGGYLLLWCDGQPEQGPLHVDLRLSREGEQVLLVGRDGVTLIDSVRFGEQATDVSHGRLGDGAAAWGSFTRPTPLAANDQPPQLPPPHFSASSGHYRGPLRLTLGAPEAGIFIYYTLDGSLPEAVDSLRYSEPIVLDSTTAVRARAWAENRAPSPVLTRTYLIDADYALPVVSLVVDPHDLYDWETGLFVPGPGVQEGDEWPFWNANWYVQGEKPAHIEFFDAERRFGFGMDVGIEIAGGWSRAFPKKSIDVKMRREYGAGRLEYPLFPDNDYDTYDGLLLRAGAEDRSRTANEIVYKAHQELGLHVDMQAYRPAVLLINGSFWGIYSLMERKDADFVANRYGEEDIDLIAGRDKIVEGSYDAYRELVDFLNENDVTADSVYAQVRERISVKGLIDMWLLHVYTNHGDEDNMRYWRPRRADGQWRWIAYDFDWWLEYDAPRLHEFAGETRARFHYLFGRLLQNGIFRVRFVNRLADFLNTVGSPERMERLLDEAVAEVAADIDSDLERWRDWVDNLGPQLFDRGAYEWLVGWRRTFVRQRPAHLRAQVVDLFGLPGLAVVTLDREGPGWVEIGTVKPDAFPWSGTYFQGIPVQIQAEPRPGYRFAGWAEEGWPDRPELTVTLTGDAKLTARFARVDGPVVINEINYHSADDADSGDWVELLNRSARTLDLSGWRLVGEGDGDEFVLPEGVLLEQGQYLVLVRDAVLFRAFFPELEAFVGDFGFGLSDGGEQISLLDADGLLVDQVAYGDGDPWPARADGGGASLELVDPAADNALAASWQAAAGAGTPGRPNGKRTAVLASGTPTGRPAAHALHGSYPNPFNATAVIRYSLPAEEFVILRLYDSAGQLVRELARGYHSAGYHAVRVDARGLASGLYLCRLRAGAFTASEKMLLLK